MINLVEYSIVEFQLIGVTFLLILMPFAIQYLQRLPKISMEKSNETLILDLISFGAINAWRSMIRLLVGVFLVFSGFFFIVFYFMDAHFIKIFMMTISLLTSVCIGYFSLKYSLNHILSFLSLRNGVLRDSNLFSCSNPMYFLVVSILSFVLFEILSLVTILKLIFANNLFNIRFIVIEALGMADGSYLNSLAYLNKENFLIVVALSGYLFGVLIHSFVARLSFASIGVSSDTAADLIGYTKYDLPENDVRNVASVVDFIGDHLKHTYSFIITVISTLALAIIFTAIFGGINGIILDRYDSFFLILLPIQIVAVGIFAFVVSEFILSFFNQSKSYFFQLMSRFLLIDLILFIVGLVSYQFKMIDGDYFILMVIGLLFSLILFLVLWFCLNPDSRFVNGVLRSNKDGIIPSICKGLCYSFFITFILGFVLVILINVVFLFFGMHFELFSDLYHISIITLFVLVSFFPILPVLFSKAIVDQCAGISDMFVYPSDQKRYFNHLDGLCSTVVGIFQILSNFILVLLLPLFLFMVLMSATFDSIDLSLSMISKLNVDVDRLLSFDFSVVEVLVMFEVYIFNPVFIAGLILGGGIIFCMAGHQMYILTSNYHLISKAVDESFSDEAVWNGEKLPNYLGLNDIIIKQSFSKVRVFVIGLIILLLLSSFFINIAGVFAIILSVGVISFILSVFFVVAGTLWKHAKLLFEKDDSLIGTSEHVSIIMIDKLSDIFSGCLSLAIVELFKFIMIFLILIIVLVIKFDYLIGFFI